MEEERTEDGEESRGRGFVKKALKSVKSLSGKGVGFNKETIVKLAKFGGNISVNRDNMWMYQGSGNTTKKLFGFSGPLHPGIPTHKESIAIGATGTDTRSTLVRELTDQSGFTRREAEKIVAYFLNISFCSSSVPALSHSKRK